ncbi:MAG: hypothetical protein RIR10_544, partial [Planctomycetota bacterium]
MKPLFQFAACVTIAHLAPVWSPLAHAQDECSTATVASEGGNFFNTSSATTSPEPVDESQCAGTYLDWGSANKDIWFTWTAPANGSLSLDTCFAGSFDTSMVVYTGSCGALTQIACNGDGVGLPGCQTYYSAVRPFAVIAGTTVFVRIGGWTPTSGVPESGLGYLNLDFQITPDSCSENAGACGQVHPNPGCNDVACCTSVCEFDPFCCSDQWTQNCVIHAGDLCGIFVHTCVDSNPAVPNDCATNAIEFEGDTFRDINNFGCNTDGPNHTAALCNSGNDFIYNDVWFRVRSIASGAFNLKTCSVDGGPVTTFDTKLAVYDMGNNPATFDYSTLNNVLVGCNDDGDVSCAAAGGIFPSDLSVDVFAGRWYLVRVGGFDQNSGTARVTFDMPEPCALPTETVVEAEVCGTSTNDGCFADGAVQQLGLNQKVKGSFWVNDDGAGGLTRDVDFYEITVPSDKEITVNVFSSSFVETIVAAGDISAADCTGLTNLLQGSGSCPNAGSVCLQAGVYYISVRASLDAGAVVCGSGPLAEYVLQVDATDGVCPSIVDRSCSSPGPDTTTTSVAQDTTGNFYQGCATGCGDGTGGSADMMFAASFSGANLLKELNCINLGVAALQSLTPAGATACGYYPSARNIPAKILIYRDLNGGAPTNPISTGIDGADLELIDSKDVVIPGGIYMGNIEFNPPLCLENESTVVVVLETYNLFNGTGIPNGIPAGAGYRSGIAVAVPAAGLPSNVWGRYTLCTGAAQNVFAPFGAGTYQWPIQMNGRADGCPCADGTDSDGDGTPDCVDGCPNDPAKTAAGACGCGVSDVDTDNDSTPDCNDGCPSDPAKIAPGACGCGVADTDSDNDGTPDCVDGCPNDPAKTAPGACGCGV